MSRSRLRNRYVQKRWRPESLKELAEGLSVHNAHRVDEMPKNRPSRFIVERIGFSKVRWLQESTSFGGHSIPKGGHRKVSGIVRAKVREEIRKQIAESSND